MFGRVPGTRPNISESHSEINTRVPFCIATGLRRQPDDRMRLLALRSARHIARGALEEGLEDAESALMLQVRGGVPLYH